MEFESESDTDNNRRHLNYIKITQTIPEQLPEKHEIKEMQKKKKTAILGTVRILREVLM